MKAENKRTLYLKVRVSPEEMAAIKKKYQNSGMSSGPADKKLDIKN